ncbi:MAG: hypothetical protein WCP06_04725 [Verrucomicrobiota bacterium]
MEAADSVAVAFTEASCVQISTLALLIAKRVGQSQPEATIRLGEKGFNNLIHAIKIWVSQLPKSCIAKIQSGEVWPHRNTNPGGAPVSLGIHVPGTPNGSDPITCAIYQVLSELGEILTTHGFNTNDIGAFYDQRKLLHLGVLLRFAWSNEMKGLFTAYQEILDAIAKLNRGLSDETPEMLRERAFMMWKGV